MKKIVLYLIAICYVLIGFSHFINPTFFINIMPPSLPYHLELVYLSGFFEISLGALLVFNKTKNLESPLHSHLSIASNVAGAHAYLRAYKA